MLVLTRLSTFPLKNDIFCDPIFINDILIFPEILCDAHFKYSDHNCSLIVILNNNNNNNITIIIIIPIDTIWRALNKAGVQSIIQPTGLFGSDGKRPEGVTLIPWAKGRCLTWDVTVPNIFATSHISSTSHLLEAAAEHAAALKKTKIRGSVTNT